MNNKSKRILALASATAILATSLPINAFAGVSSNNGLEMGPEIGVHSNVREWGEYSIEDEIPDENLKKAIRKQLGVYTITNRNILNLKKLHASSMGIKDITGLNYAKNLYTLELFGNKLTTLDPSIFRELKELVNLDLAANQLTNLDPSIFQDLPYLAWLNLHGNKITNLDPTMFKGLTNLEILYLYNLPLTHNLDPSFFKDLTNLEVLDIGGNNLTKLDPKIFRGLTKLQKLSIRNNKLTTLDPTIFRDLSNLQELDISNSNNGIKLTSLDSKLFRNLRNLQKLDIFGQKLTDLDPDIFRGLTNLQELQLAGNRLTKIDPILFKDLTNLRKLHLYYNRLTNISPIKRLNLTTRLLSDQEINITATSREINLPKISDNPKFSKNNKNGKYTINGNIVKLADDFEGKKILINFITDYVGKVDGKDSPSNSFSGTITIDTSSIKPLEYTKFKSKLNLEPVTIDKGGKINLIERLKNPPSNGTVTEIVSMDTTTSGEKTGKIKVVFSDKSELEIPITLQVTVVTEADKFEYNNKGNKKIHVETPITVVKDSKPKFADIITEIKKDKNVDGEPTITADTTNTGSKDAEIKVKFKDGSDTTVIVPMDVVDTDAAKFKEESGLTPIIVNKNDEMTMDIYKTAIKNNPENKITVDKIETNVDTTKTGKQTSKIELKFADNSTKSVNIDVIVLDVEKEKTVDYGAALQPEDFVKGASESDEITFVEKNAPNTKSEGIQDIKVKVKSNGTEKIFDVKLTVSPSKYKNFTPEYAKTEVKKEDPIDYNKPNNFIKNSLPEGVSVEITHKPSTEKPGTVYIEGKIKFKDGFEKDIKIPVTVKEWDSVTYKDKVKIADEKIPYNGTIDLSDNLPKDLPDKTTIEDITNPKIDTKVKDKHTGKAKITFPDGTTLEEEYNVIVDPPLSESFPKEEDIIKEEVDWGKKIDLTDNIKNLPKGSKVEDVTGSVINTKESGNYTGKVKITFKDTSSKVVEIPVEVKKSESENFTPTIKDEIINWGTAYDLTDNITNKPADAKIEDVTGSKINTQQSGEHTGKVKITFGDGSEKEYNVKVIVNKSESENYSKEFNNATDVTTERVIKGGTIDFTDNFKKPLPEGSTVQDITDPAIDTNKDRKYTGKAQVTFKDGSTMEVSIPVEIYISGSIIKPIPKVNNSDIEDEVVNWSGVIDLEDNIKNLPKGSGVMDITSPVIDTTKPGKYTGKVEITFPDGSKRVVEVPIEVKEAQSDTFKPEYNKEKLPHGKEITSKDIIKNIPSDAISEFIGDNKIDPTKSGKQNATIKITFIDGSTKEYPVEVEVEKSQSEKYKENPNIEPERIPRNGKIDLTDNVKDLPEGSTVVDTTKNPVDTSELGSNTGTVEVTFPDGTKAEFEVPVEVYKTEAEAFGEPITIKEVVKKGGEIDLTDNVVNLPEDARVIDTTDPKIDTNELGDYTATAKIVFKDGSETEIEIRVVVTDGKIDDTDHSRNDGNISGIITNDANGSYNGPRDFSFRAKSDGDTPEYKTSDENSQENKHKALDNLLNGISNLGRRNNTKSNENTTKYVFKIGEKSYKTIHGDNVTSHKMDVAPYIKNDRTMMPLRYVAEAIGADVQWDNSTRTAYFEKDGLVAKIQIDGNKIVMSNGKVYEMDAKPDNINDRILVSITNVSKVFNLTNGHTKDGINQNIEWNNDNRTVTIVK